MYLTTSRENELVLSSRIWTRPTNVSRRIGSHLLSAEKVRVYVSSQRLERVKTSPMLNYNFRIQRRIQYSSQTVTFTRRLVRWAVCFRCKHDWYRLRPSEILKRKLTPKKSQDPFLWGWLEIFSSLSGTNSKTTHYLLWYFSAKYSKRYRESSFCGYFEAEYPS